MGSGAEFLGGWGVRGGEGISRRRPWRGLGGRGGRGRGRGRGGCGREGVSGGGWRTTWTRRRLRSSTTKACGRTRPGPRRCRRPPRARPNPPGVASWVGGLPGRGVPPGHGRRPRVGVWVEVVEAPGLRAGARGPRGGRRGRGGGPLERRDLRAEAPRLVRALPGPDRRPISTRHGPEVRPWGGTPRDAVVRNTYPGPPSKATDPGATPLGGNSGGLGALSTASRTLGTRRRPHENPRSCGPRRLHKCGRLAGLDRGSEEGG